MNKQEPDKNTIERAILLFNKNNYLEALNFIEAFLKNIQIQF